MRQSRPKVVSAQARDEIVAQIAQALAERREIVFAYVHGSFLESRPFRDIDVAVWVDPAAVGARHPVDYEIDLGLAVQQRVRMPVDVKRLNEAPLAFRYHATRGRAVLSRDEEARDAWVERIRDAYWDFQPVARRHLVELLRG